MIGLHVQIRMCGLSFPLSLSAGETGCRGVGGCMLVAGDRGSPGSAAMPPVTLLSEDALPNLGVYAPPSNANFFLRASQASGTRVSCYKSYRSRVMLEGQGTFPQSSLTK